MIRLRFSDPDEFLVELRLSTKIVQDKIVRLTQRTTSRSGQGVPMASVQVLASCIVPGKLVVLERYMGERFATGHEDPESLKVRESAGALIARLEAACQELGLEVRAGFLEIAP